MHKLIEQIIKGLGSSDPTNEIYLLLKSNPTRPLADLIIRNSKHKILRFLLTHPNIGIIEFIEDDINNPILEEINKDPKLLFKYMERDSDNPLFFLYNEERKKQSQRFKKLEAGFKTVGNIPNPVIHYLEYKTNFHILFSDDTLTDEEIAKLESAWLTATKSPSINVDIVDSDGNVMFVHPGLMGDIDHTMGKDNWNKFSVYSDANRKKGGTHQKDFQEDHINTFLKANDRYKDDYNKNGKIQLYLINRYFDSIDDEGNYIDLGVTKKENKVEVDDTPVVDVDDSNVPNFSDDSELNMSSFE